MVEEEGGWAGDSEVQGKSGHGDDVASLVTEQCSEVVLVGSGEGREAGIRTGALQVM